MKIQKQSLETPENDFFSEQAKKAAEGCYSGGKQFKDSNKPTQLRRFYDELLKWDEKVSAHEERFTELLPLIQMMRAKAAYARSRDLIDDTFSELFDSLIRSIDSKKTLHNASLFLEAFMGYLKYFNKINDKKAQA